MTKLILGQCITCGYKRGLTMHTLSDRVYAVCYQCKRGRYFHVKLPKIIGICEHCEKYFDLKDDHSC
jgi:hypothetical protein